MPEQKINRLCGIALTVFSLIALVTVFSAYLQPSGPPEKDEGAAAHIFQLSVVTCAAALLVFVATANWKVPSRSVRPLILPIAALVLAFEALYYLEHYR